MNSDQCYNLLGLRKGASIHEIRNAYRKLALEYHPDKNTSARDGAKFKLITEAYQTLRIGNLNAGKTSGIVYPNQTSAYQKFQSRNFYLRILHHVIDHAQKIIPTKTVYQYLSKSGPILLVYCGLVQKHVVMPLYRLMGFSYARANSLVSRASYKGLIRGMLRHLGMHS